MKKEFLEQLKYIFDGALKKYGIEIVPVYEAPRSEPARRSDVRPGARPAGRPPARPAAYAPEPIRPRREPQATFARMREIGLAKPGEVNRMSPRERFLAQARFMEDFEDNCDRYVSYDGGYYFSYESPYARMKDEHLRSYFTWRSAVRRGEYRAVSEAYVRVYLCELINCVGAREGEDCLRKLAWLDGACSDAYLSRVLTGLIADYYVANRMEKPFRALMRELGVPDQRFPLHYQFSRWTGEGTFQAHLAMSEYDIRQSVFYSADKLPAFERCYRQAMDDLRALFEARRVKPDVLIWGRPRRDSSWMPFSGFISHPYDLTHSDWRVEISECEYYACKGGRLAHYAPVGYYPPGRVLLGYVFKRVEMQLRLLAKFKYRLSPKAQSLSTRLRAAGLRGKAFFALLEDGSLDRAIDGAVRAQMQVADSARRREAVKVDLRKLGRIRSDAGRVQALLTVEAPPTSPPPAAVAAVPPPAVVPPPAAVSPPDLVGAGWPGFSRALTDVQIKALLILRGGETDAPARLRELAASAGLMAEVLLDTINELSAQLVGDAVIDGDGRLLEDYEAEIGQIICHREGMDP